MSVTSRTEKLVLWSKMLFVSPQECLDRLSTLLETRSDNSHFRPPNYVTHSFTENVRALSDTLHCDLEQFLKEPTLTDLEGEVRRRMSNVAGPHFDLTHNADPDLARLCYALCRALTPKVVVETGVANGITTAHVLQAMELNHLGELWSIDLPPLGRGADEKVGLAVPQSLRQRWKLCRGKSKRVLPELVRKAAPIDLFIHDSLHTYYNELFEFQTSWPALRSGGVLVSDDIQGHPAWLEWEAQTKPRLSVVFEESSKSLLDVESVPTCVPRFGVMIKQ